MRAFAGFLLTIGVLSALSAAGAAPLQAAKPGCNGLLAFSSNRTQDAYGEIYSISLDGHRTDVSRTIGWDSDPQPSPDGSKLAFLSSGQLIVSAPDGSNPRRIGPPAGTGYGQAGVAWSPDSRRLALTVDAISRAISGNLPAVLDLGTGAWTTFGFGWDPQWSPDGTTIAYDTNRADGTTGVVLQRLDATSPTPLAPGILTAWSPDGAHLLIVNGDARVVPTAGGKAVELPDLFALAWTPDGSRLIGLKSETLETVAIDGTDPRVIAEDVLAARLSPDGRRVVLVRQSDRHIVVTTLDGHVLRDFGSWDPGPYDAHMQFQPSWSPDGAKIVYWSGGKVIVAAADTGQLHTLAGGAKETAGSRPVWSVDSSSVYDDIGDATGNTDIYVARPDGGGVHAVFVDHLPEGAPVWSPDGRRLAFIRYGSAPTLVVADLARHARVLMTLPRDPTLPRPPLSLDDSLWPSPPAWSPDGKTIAVASRTGVKLVDVRTRAVRRWPTPAGEGVPVAVAWSRQGAIATTDGLDESFIWITGKRSTRKVAVNDFYDPNYGDVTGLATNLAWSPDGSKLAFVRYGAEVGTGFFALVFDSVRIIDSNTRETRSSPISLWEFNWSPDGRYLITGGFDAEIITTGGKHVAWLRGLRALVPSWQSRCRRNG